ncbi:acyl-ACP desaturase [Streptomyces radicis]|uniref:Acyl-ACP desaturase n=1 Tax=Streptomyces radicis TaxID=1750517 RepID=A0A3A9WYH8_9ACTN|nr:acyl-ACP desaturase [Streptomyces radicis]RKN12866.1 acyl-ACP desaturase [Streptomyces radicis]RKN27369.1 acyl-ACP desaturase [Streptomyces radicis]
MRVDVLAELEPVVERNLNRHLSLAKEWMPHEYVPWEEGRDFVEQPWHPDQSRLTPEARIALEVNLLTEDNLPSYHREIANRFGRDGAWGTWVGRWTAEEGRHAMCIRDYLLVTRALDPDALEAERMAVMQLGHHSDRPGPLESLAYVSLQELATRIAHRNTGRFVDDPIADHLLTRVAADENLHMIFYRSLVTAGLEIDPSATVRAICSEITGFAMPGTVIPNFTRKSMVIARSGIYNLSIHHDEVVQPLLKHWRLFDIEGLDESAEKAREGLADHLEILDKQASVQSERFAAAEARRAARNAS